MMVLSRNFLRRRDVRRRVSFSVVLECRDATQKVSVADFSASGLRIDGINNLAAGDPVRVYFTPTLAVAGEIVWSVWHKAGVKLTTPLTEDDPAYEFLVDKAETIERTRELALAALAREKSAVR
jgi:hypothetical protein